MKMDPVGSDVDKITISAGILYLAWIYKMSPTLIIDELIIFIAFPFIELILCVFLPIFWWIWLFISFVSFKIIERFFAEG